MQLVGRKFALAGLAIGKGQVVRVPVEHVGVEQTEGLALVVESTDTPQWKCIDRQERGTYEGDGGAVGDFNSSVAN